jgi:hypothetical protein
MKVKNSPHQRAGASGASPTINAKTPASPVFHKQQKTSEMRPVNFEKEMASLRSRLGAGYKGIMSESILRAEVDLIDATGVYAFDFRNAKGIKQLTEVLLKENDLFRVLGVRFNLAVRKAAIPTAYVPQTYPNKIVFATETADTPAGTFDADHLEAIYNAGSISYKKGDTVFLPTLSLRDSRFVGQTQKSSAANTTSTEFFKSGVLPVQRPFNLIGTDLGETSLNIPGAQNLKLQYSTVANLTTNGLKIIAICTLEGILASGGNKISSGVTSMDI